jgi:superfamily II DNA or RNA helicase
MPPLVRLASRRYAGLPPFRQPRVNASALLAQSSDSFYDSLHSDLQSQYAERSGPPLFIPPAPAPMKHALDVEAAQTWVYPVNLPLRDYQFNIVRAALFRNTLAALPTGLGKTFIAGCVMLNYARWYPTAKIFFVAPTKPLVNQQAQAFPETCGFLNSKITVLNGDTSGDKREQLYPTKQVFFMTAQTMMNDLSNGRLDPRDVVLLVVGALGSLIFVGPRATSLVAHRC